MWWPNKLTPSLPTTVDPAVVGAANLKRCLSNAFSQSPRVQDVSNDAVSSAVHKSLVPPSELSTIQEDSREEELRLSNTTPDVFNVSDQSEVEAQLRAAVAKQDMMIQAQRAELKRVVKRRDEIMAA